MAKILVVEDDVALARSVKDCLVFDSHTVEMVHSGGDALQLMEVYKYDLLILDWELPELSGVELCAQYRSKGGVSPIMFLTGKKDISDKEISFETGADDYMTKPFDERDLRMRIKALLRRAAGMGTNVLEVGGVRINLSTFDVQVDGKNVHLLPKEFALLEFLCRHPNQVFSAEALLERVWSSETDSSANTVRTNLYTLRKKISPKGKRQLLETVHGMGYKFNTEAK